MVWVIFIHVIIEVIDKSMLVKTSSFFTIFSFCNCINFGGMAGWCYCKFNSSLHICAGSSEHNTLVYVDHIYLSDELCT